MGGVESGGVTWSDVKLPNDAVLVEQNPRKETQWAKMACKGHKVAWAIRGDEYLARVIDGRVKLLNRPEEP